MNVLPLRCQLTNVLASLYLSVTALVTAGGKEEKEEEDRYISQVKLFQERVSHCPSLHTHAHTHTHTHIRTHTHTLHGGVVNTTLLPPPMCGMYVNVHFKCVVWPPVCR